jgi:glycosyltransferase involved in cell wall biosynthesis
MTATQINLCAIGDPTDPRTWSGTPYNLYSVLKQMNCLSSAFNSIAVENKKIQRFISLFSKLFYGTPIELNRGFLMRYLNAAKVKSLTARSNSRSTLHTGTLDLPFLIFPANQKHYLYCDFTWNLAIQSPYLSSRIKKIKSLEQLERRAFLQMEHIFPISEFVKENLISHYGIPEGKITVAGTGLGVIKPFFGQKEYTNHKILYAAKGLFKNKGGDLVLEAFQMAWRKNPSLELIIVGHNEYTHKIHIPNVITYGFIPDEELQSLFDECSLFLMPAIHEPWGLVYLEALACKMPIVGLNRNSFPEISGYGQYGFMLDDPNPAKLCDIILDAFAHPQLLAEIGEKGQRYCLEKYSWNHTLSKIIQTIKKNKKLNVLL